MEASMIRDYRPEDARTLSSYLEQIREAENYPPTKLSGEDLVNWFNVQDLLFRMVFVDENDIPLGHVATRTTFPADGNTGKFLYDNPSDTGLPWFEMTKLFTAPHARGKGIGESLMFAAIEGIHNLDGAPCLVVNADAAAVNFYLTHGWVILGGFPAISNGRELLAMEFRG
jgi:GNAT superfamily N-acetyltransferase